MPWTGTDRDQCRRRAPHGVAFGFPPPGHLMRTPRPRGAEEAQPQCGRGGGRVWRTRHADARRRIASMVFGGVHGLFIKGPCTRFLGMKSSTVLACTVQVRIRWAEDLAEDAIVSQIHNTFFAHKRMVLSGCTKATKPSLEPPCSSFPPL